jgi:putative endonuclease
VDKSSLGRAAEQMAAEFLQASGYRIVCRNYRTRYAEIDIIARERGVLCFIEVRSRETGDFGTPEESITRRKRRGIERAALQYLEEQGLPDADARFDVVGIEGRGDRARVNLTRNAFELEGEP